MAEMVTVAMTCPGYESNVMFPLHGPDAQSAFCTWLEMQLRYLKARKPGVTVEVRESAQIDTTEGGSDAQ